MLALAWTCCKSHFLTKHGNHFAQRESNRATRSIARPMRAASISP